MIAVGFQGRPRVGLFYNKQFPVETRLAASRTTAPCPRDLLLYTRTTLGLPKYRDPRNLVRFPHLPHTRLTYHRTWETGLETEIRVAAFSPAFFCPHERLAAQNQHFASRVSPVRPLCSSVLPVVQAFLCDRNPLQCGRNRELRMPTLTHPNHSPHFPPFHAPHRIESETIESILPSPK